SSGNGFFRSTECVHLLNQLKRASLDFGSQALDVIASRQRIHRVRDSRLVRDDLLRAQSKLGGFSRRQGQRFVVTVRMQRLSPAKRGGKGLHGDPNDIVEGLLGGQRHTTCLGVKSESAAAFRSSKSITHDASI